MGVLAVCIQAAGFSPVTSAVGELCRTTSSVSGTEGPATEYIVEVPSSLVTSARVTSAVGELCRTTSSVTGQIDTLKTAIATERTDTLKAAVFTGRSVKHFSDHQKFYLSSEDRNAHATALETLKLIPGIMVRDDEVTLVNGKGLTILLNGLPTTSASLSLLTPVDIKSIDFYQNAPARYSFAGSGSLVNIITRRPGIGGNLMLNLKEAVTTPWGNNAASYRQVLKNTMIGIEYSGKPSKSGGYGIDEFLEY